MNKSAYYLLTGGEVLDRAQKHRAAHIRLMSELFDFAKKHGGTAASIDKTMMLLRGVVFEGEAPKGWTAPTKKDRLARPRKTKNNEALLKMFTPSGGYWCKPNAELAEFDKWLACPCSIRYTTDGDGWGHMHIGNMFNPIQLAWFDADSPILLATPDVQTAKKEADERGIVPEDKAVFDWTPPAGCERILIERWKLMEAEHKAAQEETASI